MVATKTHTTQIERTYREQVLPSLQKEFGIKNPNAVPRLTKIVVNVGIGKQLENQKLKPEIRDTVISTITKITGQKPVMVLAKKSVSNFKVREGAPSGFMVTLRRERMWTFLERLVHLAMPRIKDFRGVSDRNFDTSGNYSVGLTEQAVWPEINMAEVNFTHGMNVNLVISNSTPAQSRALLAGLGMPFEQKEEPQGKKAKG